MSAAEARGTEAGSPLHRSRRAVGDANPASKVDDLPTISRGDKAKAAFGVLGEGSNKVRNVVASIVWLLAVLGAVILALGALLFALDAANRDYSIVNFFIETGERLVGPFGDPGGNVF